VLKKFCPSIRGTVFQVNTDGTSFTTLHTFPFQQGTAVGDLVVVGNTVYGTSEFGAPVWPSISGIIRSSAGPEGVLWFGTEKGASRYDCHQQRSFHATANPVGAAKCYLRSLGQHGIGNDYADWVKEQAET
jgi:hypothetical protein